MPLILFARKILHNANYFRAQAVCKNPSVLKMVLYKLTIPKIILTRSVARKRNLNNNGGYNLLDCSNCKHFINLATYAFDLDPNVTALLYDLILIISPLWWGGVSVKFDF